MKHLSLLWACLAALVPGGVAFCGGLTIGGPVLIATDTTWSGKVEMAADVLVLPGVTLTIAPGTTVTVLTSDSTKTEPEFLSSLTELTVRGRLRVLGEAGAEVVFRGMAGDRDQADGMGGWSGINIDGGEADLGHCRIGEAESAVTVWRGKAEVGGSRLEGNRYGLSLLGEGAHAVVNDTAITGNEYGVVTTGPVTLVLRNSEPQGNRQRERLDWAGPGYLPEAPVHEVADGRRPAPYGSESLLGTIVWQDRVVVNGIIRIPEKSRLIIMPGTVVEFSRNDTNGDAIGENGLLVMGMLVAKGTKENPIVFRSAEKERRPGDWDAINIFVSDGFQNLIEHCVIEDAYRGLHFHFSNVLVSNTDVRDNYRGLQFQESLITIRDSDIHNNRNALRARDSELEFVGNRVYGNGSGPNIYRASGRVADNIIAANASDGLRVREGALAVTGNAFIGNRYGLLFAYANAGSCNGNVMAANAESGLILKGTDNVHVEGNFIQGNGGNGISLLGARAEILGNQIAGNGERGIGIQSFDGRITGNNLLGNRLYDLGLDGAMDINASGNHWGGADLGKAIFDRADDPGKGRVTAEPALPAAAAFTWPRPDILADTVWQGNILLPPRVKTRATTKLTILPGSIIRLGRDGLFWLEGEIEAAGSGGHRILFTAAERAKGVYWNQMTTEMSKAVFRNCDFEHASMAVHSHFSHVEISDCRFRDNESGFRFRGGPVVVENSRFEGNVYGIVSYLARATIKGNSIIDNDIGILVRAEQRGGMHVNRNNIEANHHYNVRMGDFNSGGNVDARDNWWGGGDPAEKFFDERLEPGIGFVDFEPAAPAPFAIGLPAWTRTDGDAGPN